MDKKSNHSRQGSSKAQQSSEVSRKSSDLCTSRQWPRNARRRENPNQSNCKQDPARVGKPQSAKGRLNVDKRPRSRGFGHNFNGSSASPRMPLASSGLALEEAASLADGGATNADDLIEAELNSIYMPGSRKQNLNHLLNFHYASREYDGAHAATFNAFSSGNRHNNRGGITRRHKYNKEQFLQANFQFVLKSEENITQNIASPDTLVDWNLIEQINIQTTEEPQCPICLYPPIAAKLTRCGHAYCWPCVLHYLALSDKSWRKCPICYDAVHINDLKSTRIVQLQNCKVGDMVTMQLMRRLKGSMFIEQVGHVEQPDYIPHLRDDNNMKKFSKFLLADSSEILSIIERERKELVAVDHGDTPESIFIKQALDLLEERESKIVVKPPPQVADKYEVLEFGNGELVNQELADIGEQLSEMSFADRQSVSSFDISEDSSNTPMLDESKYYYFYQSNDGQNIYMHVLNVKILQAMYGSLGQSPSLIEGKILEKHSYSMDEDLRKKLRYLQHMPLTCQFDVVELQFDPPTVSAEILDRFKDVIISRQKTRMRRAREERKRERQIDEINERQMGKIIARSANIDINSSQQFPSCGSDDFLMSNSIGDFPLSLSSELSSSPPPSGRPAASTSFAQMLSPQKREFWPTLGKPKVAESLGAATVWGKPAAPTPVAKIGTTSNRQAVTRIVETEDLEELEFQPLQHNLADVIVEALQQKHTDQAKQAAPTGNGGTVGGGKKNKKNKKTLLFSTGMNHKGN